MPPVGLNKLLPETQESGVVIIHATQSCYTCKNRLSQEATNFYTCKNRPGQEAPNFYTCKNRPSHVPKLERERRGT